MPVADFQQDAARIAYDSTGHRSEHTVCVSSRHSVAPFATSVTKHCETPCARSVADIAKHHTGYRGAPYARPVPDIA
eukprot:2169321-Rhodomonas_salina.2